MQFQLEYVSTFIIYHAALLNTSPRDIKLSLKYCKGKTWGLMFEMFAILDKSGVV